MTGNYDDNALAYFESFANAATNSELHQRAMRPAGVDRLRNDVLAGRLPQVSWIVTPAAFSEHPSYPPAYGAIYIARVLEALTADRDTWNKTALFLNYDENDGLFDHVIPPQPPTPVLPGISTVSTDGEIHDTVNPDYPRPYTPDQLPYGLGPRVPMLVISPWSKGGYVCSEVFDHTSVIRFLETRFGVKEPNISAWRRAICGDLTSAFDFQSYKTREIVLPSTTGYWDLSYQESRLPAATVPRSQVPEMPAQEAGVRPTRPLPYALELNLAAAGDGVHLNFHNRSRVGVCCTAFWDASEGLPRRYTLGAGHQLEDVVALPKGQPLAMSVYGPNGFLRRIRGTGETSLEVLGTLDSHGDLALRFTNAGARALTVLIRDEAYGQPAHTLRVAVREPAHWRVELARSHHWYDVTVSTEQHQWRFAGHAETGCESRSDPAVGTPVLQLVGS